MNINFTITSYPPSIGGAQLHTALIARHLSIVHLVKIISLWDMNRTDWLLGTTLRAQNNDKQYLDHGIQVNQIGFNRSQKFQMFPFVMGYYFWMGLAISGISKIFEQKLFPLTKSADIIHNVRIGREPLSYASSYTSRKLGIPFVFTPLHHPRWSGWLHRHYQDLYRKADALTALTEVEKKTLIGFGVNENKIFVTGIGPIVASTASPANFRNQISLDNYPFVLFLGQKYEYKGVRALLEAARLVWKRCPETFFVFIGPRTKYSKALFSEVTDKRILELDTVDLQTKTDALAACNLLCVPSTQESFGGVYTEAWSFAKPVIGCPIPAVSEVIEDGVNGLLSLQEPQALAEKIIQVINDESFANQLGQAGRLKVEERYTWDKIANKTLNAYNRTLSGKY